MGVLYQRISVKYPLKVHVYIYCSFRFIACLCGLRPFSNFLHVLSTGVFRTRMASSSSKQQSTVPPSPSAVVIADLELDRLSKAAFEKSGQYLAGILEGTADDYKLLEQMNDVTTQRYADIKQVAVNVTKSLEDLNTKYDNLRPYLDLIDDVDRSSKRLEEAAYAIDAYVKTLEAKFKQLEKR